jgi:hypothetical protein
MRNTEGNGSSGVVAAMYLYGSIDNKYYYCYQSTFEDQCAKFLRKVGEK